jgi:hypothetical protein
MTQENEKKQEKTIKERVKAVLDAHQAHQLSSWERHTFLPSICKVFNPEPKAAGDSG